MNPAENKDNSSEELIREPRRHPWLWLVVSLLAVLLMAGWTSWVISRYWKTVQKEDPHGDR